MVDLEARRRQQARRAAFEDYRRQGARVWIGPRGTSMRPLIGAQTKLLVEFGAAAEIGDIIVFPLGDILVAHRLVARRQRQGVEILIAKGDAEPYFDPPVQPGDLLGVVRALRRNGAAPATSLGCAGWTARLIARISYSGRSQRMDGAARGGNSSGPIAADSAWRDLAAYQGYCPHPVYTAALGSMVSIKANREIGRR